MINFNQLNAKVSILALSAICSVFSANANAGGQFIGLGTGLGAFDYDTVRLSANGLVVTGEREIASPYSFPIYDNAIWTQTGGMVGILDLTGGVFGGFSAINADGSVIIGSASSNGVSTMYRWSQASGAIALSGLPRNVRGVSADGGVIIGLYNSTNGTEAFRWTETGGVSGLGDLPGGNFDSYAQGVSADGSVVVGSSASSSGFEAFRWTQNGGMVGLGYVPGYENSSRSSSVSANGSVIIGDSYSDLSERTAFVWTQAEGLVGLNDLTAGVSYSRAFGLSEDGSVVVGEYGASYGEREAFLWTEDNGLMNLKSWLTSKNVDLSGFTSLTSATGISADGNTFVGYGINLAGQREAFYARITAVPEPESHAMIMVGAVVIAFIQRRKKRYS